MTETNEPHEILPGKLILIAGSAAAGAPGEKLARAHDFVKLLVRRVLGAGGGLIVFASNEPTSDTGTPLIFDWTILREIELVSPQPRSAPRVVIVTSDKARAAKMNDSQRSLLARLSSRGIADVIDVPNAVHTGGNIGYEQTSRAAAMIAIGGGKGVTDRAWKLQKTGVPVLPFDLKLGSLSDDGDGALGLHRAFLAEPRRFFATTGDQLRGRALGLSLELPVLDLPELAAQSIAAISAEIEAARQAGPIEVLLLTALPVELQASLDALGVAGNVAARAANGTNYWRTLTTRASGADRAVAVACFGSAGNVDAAATTAALMAELRPRAVVMIGIAAGMRDKCKLGEVVIADRIVAYEGSALIGGPEGSRNVSRHDSYRTPHAVQQDIVAYLADEASLRTRLRAAYDSAGIQLPEYAEAGPVAVDVVPRQATLASGEKLLRDPERFRALREIHGKIEVVEMEAAGIATACAQVGAHYLIVRGISDFGDERKDDRFHAIAAKVAVVVAVDFIRHGLGDFTTAAA